MREKPKRFPVASGFSSFELIAALALMGIVMAMALPNWSRLLPSYHLDGSARQIQSELHNIKMRAVAENVSFQLSYLTNGSAYTIERESIALITKPLSEGVMVTKAGAISFSPRGTAGANRVRLRNSEGLCKQVVVSATGRIRICKPSDCSGDC